MFSVCIFACTFTAYTHMNAHSTYSAHTQQMFCHAGNEYACKYAHTKHVQSICCVVIICYTPLLCAYLHAHLLPTHT